MEGFAFFDIIFFALLAAYILNRLRATLGQDDGERIKKKDGRNIARLFDVPADEKDKQAAKQRLSEIAQQVMNKKPAEEKRAAPAEVKAEASLSPTIAKAVERIKEKDAQFSVNQFLTGAKAAFEMVLEAFDEGDRETLRNLLSDGLYKEFDEVITSRDGLGQVQKTTLVALQEPEILSASLRGTVAKLVLRFKSEQIAYTKDNTGKVIEGDMFHVEQVEDTWTFQRDIATQDPNWVITEMGD